MNQKSQLRMELQWGRGRSSGGREKTTLLCSAWAQSWMGWMDWDMIPIWESMNTLPKFNVEPTNDGFQKEFPIPGRQFQVPC